MPAGHLFNFAGNTSAEIIETPLYGMLPSLLKFLSMPVGHYFLLMGIGQVPFYARWASFFDRLCLLIRIGQTGLEKNGHHFLKGFACCRDEMPAGHYF